MPDESRITVDEGQGADRVTIALQIIADGHVLGNLDRWEDAIAIYEEVARLFGKDADPMMRLPNAMAMQAKALAQSKLGRDEDAITTYRAITQRFGGEEDVLVLRELVANSLLYSAAPELRVGCLDDSLASMSEVIKRYGEAPEPSLRLLVMKALDAKGKTLVDVQRFREALGAFDEVLVRSIGAEEPLVLDYVAWALVQKATVLGLLGELDDLPLLLEEAIERFEDSEEPDQASAAVNARKLLRAYQAMGTGRPGDSASESREV